MKTEISAAFLALAGIFAVSGAVLVVAPPAAVIATFVFVLSGWIISLCLHEYAHAATAAAFGDTTIADSGYLTLNPMHYFRGTGSLVLPVIALVMGGIALPGGAVMIRNDLITRRWQRSLVALAGPLTTLLALVVSYAAAVATVSLPLLHDALILLAFFELMAFVLNILPVPGLDGFAVVGPWLPKAVTAVVPRGLGGIITLVLLVAVFFYGYRIIMPVMGVIVHGLRLDFSGLGDGYDRFHFW